MGEPGLMPQARNGPGKTTLLAAAAGLLPARGARRR